MSSGPRIYNLFPLLAGSVEDWSEHLPRIAAMRFDWVYLNPFHYPGFSGSLYAVKDYDRLHPVFQGRSEQSPPELLRGFLDAARRHGLRVMMDLVINHTSKDALLVREHPEWYLRDARGEVKSPSAIDPANADNVTVWGDLAELDYRPGKHRDAMVEHWTALVQRFARLGFAGFRCDAAYKVPAEVWQPVIEAGRAENRAVFFAETLGCRLEEMEQLAGAGFDYFFNSAKWWDFREDWLLEQYDAFRRVAPSIAFPESHDTDRLAAELAARGVTDRAVVEAVYRQRYLFAAFFSSGVMLPMGYERGARKRLDVVGMRPADQEKPLFDLSRWIAEVNALKASLPPLNQEGPQVRITPREAPVVGLLRTAERGDGRVLALINPDGEAHQLATETLGALDARTLRDVTPGAEPLPLAPKTRITLRPWEVRLYAYAGGGGGGGATDRAPEREGRSAETATLEGAVMIEGVYPEIDGGRHPVKRVVGDVMVVEADIYREGHDHLAALVRYRGPGEHGWREAPMELVNPGLDRWRGRFPLTRNGRHHYTIVAWMDAWETWRAEVGKKRAAGQRVHVELEEGRLLLEQTLPRVDDGGDRRRLEQVLADWRRAEGDDERADLLLSEPVRQLMARWPDRSRATAYDRELEVFVDRERAVNAAWYELFPRSQSGEPGRSGTFDDCIRRLPEIAAMGFDVLYLVPIHPIGRSHRKGPNNSLVAGPDDPGSPYAIGGEEGGHQSIHPELGTLEDFRRLVGACAELGLEVALDIAIQCSPDHPYVREHPEWFTFRPDGTIKYAENPPKKYQDIVNLDFHGPHREALWAELRSVFEFWIAQGVKTFRVDNPHTKPFRFWEWCIRGIQDRHPDVVFLSEAFTRPRLLQGLAKLGFTQSYTYFTWRNFKEEITAYLTELTRGEVREYLRPNFFVNTPDINPFYLQTGGRAAHRIRLVLAATLSGVYGVYEPFVYCEATPVPGKEEYLDSEKYQLRTWDHDRPGHIKDDVARINRIRRENPALHRTDNLRFHPADSDDVLFYGKTSPDRRNVVFVAVNLDPFDAHEATLTLPLAEMGLPETEAFEVEELLTGRKHLWRGPTHRVKLDPERNPAEIYRITPFAHIDYREPCY